MKACQDYEELLTLHAAGALEPEAEARVRAHLESCAACRSDAVSTASVLALMTLPPPSPAMQERVEALPRKALSAWRRQQVHQALRARTVGALLAAAAVVMMIVAPSLLRPPSPPVASPSPTPAASSEAQADFEQWASMDPLAEVIDLADAEEDAEASDEEPEADLSVSELFLNLNTGETL